MLRSIKQKLYWGFSLFVLVFLVNGIITTVILNGKKKKSVYLSNVIDPAQRNLHDLKVVITESKMYTTNWVFLRTAQDDKDALIKLHQHDYPLLKKKLVSLLAKLNDDSITAKLDYTIRNFELLINYEKEIISTLREFGDYDDPVKKMYAEQIVEDIVIPITADLLKNLERMESRQEVIRDEQYGKLDRYSFWLRLIISLLAVLTVVIAILLSVYFTKVVMVPIKKMQRFINGLSKGIVNKVEHNGKDDEVGAMVYALNNLSEKILETAKFAQEVGNRNFSIPYKPLSSSDVLGKALLTMRNNLKKSEEDLSKATSGLIQRNKALEQYTYIVSHNLRSPVSTILGFSDLLLDGDIEKEESHMVVDGLRVSAQKLDGVIRDLNHILEAKQNIHERMEKICLATLVEELKSIFKFNEQADIEFKCDLSEIESIFSFKSYVVSIFYNLVSNSIKYRRDGVKLVIEMVAHKEENKAVFFFRDNGKGIDLDRNGEKLFGLYERFDFEAEGKGMGLFMIKSQVENLDGTISVQSEIGSGTEFRIELPLT